MKPWPHVPRARIARVALGLDVRVRTFLEQAGAALDAVASHPERELEVLFFDASDQALLRRFSSTRRPHPLSMSPTPGEEGAAGAVLDGVLLERERLSRLRARATHVVDTTRLSVHELRRRVVDLYSARAQRRVRGCALASSPSVLSTVHLWTRTSSSTSGS